MKIFLLLAFLSITQVLGDIFLSRGMKDFVGFDPSDPTIILYLITYVLTNHGIVLGLGILIISLSLYLTAISKLDLSYVLPIHASSYVLNGIFAWAILGEDVTGMRWVSTFIISCGALCVGLSESSTADSVQHNNLKSRNLPLFFLPFSLTISKTWLAIMISSVSDASGDLLLAVGMKKIGEIERVTLPEVKKMIIKIITSPLIISGIACQGIAFFSFISVLSWTDISFARPATALTYIISMLGAKLILKENIQRQKLWGIILIGLGVFIHR